MPAFLFYFVLFISSRIAEGVLPTAAQLAANLSYPIDIVLTCPASDISKLAKHNVNPHFLSTKICKLLKRIIRCETRDYYVHNPDKDIKTECRKHYNLTTVASYALKQHFLISPVNTISFMTSNWEVDGLLHLKSQSFPVAVSPKSTIITLSDKLHFQHYMQNHPELSAYIPNQYETIETAKYPCVLKLESLPGDNSMFNYIVKSPEEAREILTKNNRDHEPFLLQQYIRSDMEMAVFFVAYEGQLLDLFECRLFTLLGGMQTNTEITTKRQRKECLKVASFSELKKIISIVTEELHINGIGFIQVKQVGNELKVMEIQARIPYGLFVTPLWARKLGLECFWLAQFMRMYWLAHVHRND